MNDLNSVLLEGKLPAEPINIQVLEVEIFGCIFFKGKHIKLDIAALANGLTGIGYGNGVGKSSVLFSHISSFMKKTRCRKRKLPAPVL